MIESIDWYVEGVKVRSQEPSYNGTVASFGFDNMEEIGEVCSIFQIYAALKLFGQEEAEDSQLAFYRNKSTSPEKGK